MTEHVPMGSDQRINLAKILETEDYSLENIEAVALSLGGRAGADYFLGKRFPELGGRTPVDAIEEGDGERALGLLINY